MYTVVFNVNEDSSTVVTLGHGQTLRKVWSLLLEPPNTELCKWFPEEMIIVNVAISWVTVYLFSNETLSVLAGDGYWWVHMK